MTATDAPVEIKKPSTVEFRRFSAMNPPDYPRRADNGERIEVNSGYQGEIICYLYAVTPEGKLEKHRCLPAVHQLIMNNHPDRNKKQDYTLGFRDGVVVSVTPAQRPTTMSGFEVDDPEKKAMSNILVLDLHDGGQVLVSKTADRMPAPTLQLVVNEVMEFTKAGKTLLPGQALQGTFPIKEIRSMVGYQQLYIEGSTRM